MDSHGCQIEMSVTCDVGTCPGGVCRVTAPLACSGGHALGQTSFLPFPIRFVGVNRSLFIARQHLLRSPSLSNLWRFTEVERDGCTTIDLT